MRVLAADDDEQVRDILARLLSRLGAEVSLAGCGEEARSGRGRVRLVALTGADCSRSSDARREGFDVFLQKPVGLEELRRELAAAAP